MHATTGYRRGIAVASRSPHACATVVEVPQAKRRATYEDLMQVPDTKVAELIDGELVVTPRPASPHTLAASVLGMDIGGLFHRDPDDPARPGGWWILLEPELHFGDDVVVPDWAGWRRIRLPNVTDVPFFTLPPDWVCEVVSPSTGRIDRSRKMRIYGEAGVPSLWLVDPLARTLELYRRDGDRWIVAGVHGGDDVVRAEPFDAVELALARWWLPDATG
jgi:Uma2 family endonuclease